ncbi:hypothetical protein [Micromonospora echinofusca]|uniref:Uncharacterized protein n=1 Tax=Micromonospora echinofusca TaxID=47858 RepID=A0ABS3VLD2_MICEH|nr:hypothetical protein [Micromonospora echinofusca]MBO4205281.1 hypothetical protein [Micromonospora echinofusca]
MTAHEPKRTRRQWSTNPDVFKPAGTHGFTGSAKSGRTWSVSKHRPAGDTRPGTRTTRR